MSEVDLWNNPGGAGELWEAHKEALSKLQAIGDIEHLCFKYQCISEPDIHEVLARLEAAQLLLTQELPVLREFVARCRVWEAVKAAEEAVLGIED